MRSKSVYPFVDLIRQLFGKAGFGFDLLLKLVAYFRPDGTACAAPVNVGARLDIREVHCELGIRHVATYFVVSALVLLVTHGE